MWHVRSHERVEEDPENCKRWETMERRAFIVSGTATILVPGVVTGLVPSVAFSVERDVWSAVEIAEALDNDSAVMIDVRSRQEWQDTGIAQGAWPISMHEQGFQDRLFAARTLAQGKPIALICATGGRSGRVFAALKRAGYDGFVDISEGMLGSRSGPGWIKRGLPVVKLEQALSDLPNPLK